MNKEQELINLSINLATKWQKRATELVSDFDKKFHIKMKKLLDKPEDKSLLIELMDQSFRTKSNKRVANQIIYLLDKHGLADFFTTKDRMLLWFFQNFAMFLPNISVPIFINQIREDSKSVVIKAEKEPLIDYLMQKKAENTTVNINLIGEVVLGEEEASQRIEKYLEVIKNPNINYLSIKISTLYSQINSLDFETTVEILVDKLSLIYAQAQECNTFINLDMEEYRDLSNTMEVFKKTLEKKEFKNFYAGIVLQAYLPDSFILLQALTAWAKQRVSKHGSAIKVRIVKGANMQMEKTEASTKNWELVTYDKKVDTDSNYKKMIRFALLLENAQCVHIGTASHNLFELAYATIYAKENESSKYHTIEMLEGMSESARLAIKEISKDVIVYAPIASEELFTNAIAYLVRRLDENTQKDNFIRYSFGLEVNSEAWNQQKEFFLQSFENEKKLFVGLNRKQNRLTEHWDDYKQSSYDTKVFKNEADTDFILENNRIWGQKIKNKWKHSQNSRRKIVPLVIANEEIIADKEEIIVYDKSQVEHKIIVGKFCLADKDDINRAVLTAFEDKEHWRDKSDKQRHQLLKQAAINIRKKRGDLIGISAAEVGKIFSQSDVEVSESVDFLEFYPYSINYFKKYENLEFKAKGVGVVVSPWNFPIAIVLGGIAASLSSGNCVIVKPASASVLCAYELCQCFWQAGISKNVLQFVPCKASLAQKYLINNKHVDYVILTGSEDTAKEMLKQRSNLLLSAETGGKNATIVTAMADREQAIKNICQSAYANSGQKCSATSLLVLEKEVYEDENFKKMLIDSANSIPIGSVWNFKNILTTLIAKPSLKLKKALENQDNGEYWVLKPSFANENPLMLKPSIKWAVKENSFCHKTELFAPILSVMKADDLKHAIQIVNSTGYGLTSGLESLDEREIEYWKTYIKAGNLYINRSTTGAIVLRQPFGGVGKSAVGAGRKVGFFNYVTQFMNFNEMSNPKQNKKYHNKISEFLENYKKHSTNKNTEEIEKLEIAFQSYCYNYETEFSKQKEYTHVRGEQNIFRYMALKRVVIRAVCDDCIFDIVSRVLAAKISKVNFRVSIYKNSKIKEFLKKAKPLLFTSNDEIIEEDDNEFANSLIDFDRIIYSNIKKVPKIVFEKASKNMIFIVRQKPMREGRLELLNYFCEQSISHSYHRYGNLGLKELE